MTTLPQTTPLHISRAMSPVSVPSSYPIAAPIGAPAAVQMTGADFWRVIRANLWLLIVLGGISSVAGYGVYSYLLKYYPEYRARAFIEVRTTLAADSMHRFNTGMDSGQLLGELKTQAQLLKSDELFASVLKDNPKIQATAWAQEYGSSAERKKSLQKNFQVTSQQDSKLLEVTMDYKVKQDCVDILEAVVDAHLKREREKVEGRVKEQISVLRTVAASYDERTREVRVALNNKQRSMHEKGFGRVSITQQSARELELNRLIENLSKVDSNATEAKRTYEQTMATINEGRTPPMVLQQVELDQNIRDYEARLDAYKIEIQAQLLHSGEKSRTIMDLRKRIEESSKVNDARRAELTLKYQEQLVDMLRDAVDRTAAERDGFKEKVDKARNEWAAASDELAELLNLEEDDRVLRDMKRQVNDELRDQMAIQSAQNPTRVDWAAHPQPPELPNRPDYFTMAASIALGLALALGIAFLREFMDTTVRSPRDISRIGQMTLLGLIPDENEDPQAAATQFPLVIFEAPHSITAEQFRQMRTRLQHAASLDTTRSIMVTGPSPMDGKTTIACNLAAGLALNGRKILLVDANFRRPDLHRIFGLGNDQGFSDVLNGTVAFDDVVRETQVPNLSMMSAGPKPMNPTELFESQLLIDFIERALEEFDHVIFDSGPLLLVSESVAMAPRVDGVITVVRAHADSRGLMTRMRDELRRVKAEHLGVVLNAVRAQGGGYYKASIRTYYEYQGQE